MTSPGRPLDDEALRQLYGEAIGAPSPHPSEDEWERFAAGDLGSEERERLADHVTRCAECADIFRVVSEVRDGASAIDVAAVPPAAADAPRWGGWRQLAAAAALIAVVGGSWRLLAPRGVASSVATNPPAAPSTSVAARPAPSTPAVRGWAALPVAPAVMLPPSFTLTVRGPGRPDADRFLEAFGPAIAPYRAQQYTEAARALADVAQRFPDVVEGSFYLGVSRLLAGDAEGALDPLRRARASNVVAADAAWLEAVAQERAGHAEVADTLLRRLCPAAGTGDIRACAALERR